MTEDYRSKRAELAFEAASRALARLGAGQVIKKMRAASGDEATSRARGGRAEGGERDGEHC